jgi:tripartite-type tricarboxylate transporter receptor subunit TctC
MNAKSNCAILLMLGMFCSAHAQNYPVKSVRVVVGYAAGGAVDIFARNISQKLGESLGQQFVVDNRAGAGSNIASDIVAKAPADGYTLLVTNIAFAVNPGLFAKLPFDPVKDFAPVGQFTALTNVLVVHPSVPVTSVKELIALAKSNPGRLNYGSAGNGSSTHLAAELFKNQADVNIVHIPYNGAAPAIVALLGGQVDLMFATVPTALPQVKAGRMRALAVASMRRATVAPQWPTVSESGLPGFDVSSWIGLIAPAGTPGPVIAKLNQEIARIVRLPEIQDQFAREGGEATTNTPEQFAAYIKSEISKWGKVVQQAKLRVD